MAEAEYVFQQAEDRKELERLQAIERVFDPASRRRLLATGLKAGWRCLEVGAGAGSVMRWMSEAVGPTGQVVAVDIAPKFLVPPQPANVEVRQADIRTAPLPPQSFDLAHVRYVLIHLPDFEAALTKILACLKPGGWVVLEEPDFSASRGVTGEVEELESVGKVNQAIKVMYDKLGMDYALGLKLPSLLQGRGLQEMAAETDAVLAPGGSGLAEVMRMSAVQLREKYLATGVVTEQDLDRYGRFAENPKTRAVYYATVAASGRKPA